MAEQITEEGYRLIGIQLCNHIFKICKYLPCPDCSNHASQFLARLKMENFKTKQDLKNILYIFHNVVNKRKQKPMFHTNNLSIYKNKNIINVYNQFILVYNTKGNMKLLTDTFQRQQIISSFKKWLFSNLHFFIHFKNVINKPISYKKSDEDLSKKNDENNEKEPEKKEVENKPLDIENIKENLFFSKMEDEFSSGFSF
jgi:hypothetical protein